MPADSIANQAMKTVLISGASSGFGLAACEVFLQKGWKVYAAVRGGMQRKDLYAHLWAHHPERLSLLELDLTVPSTIESVCALFQNEALDVVINNAGYGLFGSTEDMSEASLRRQMEVNFFGTLRLTQLLLPNLRKNHGAVITVSSVVGRHALPLTGAYCASKFAVEGWMESLSMEVKPFGVDCYLIEPGTYPTQFGSGIDWAVPAETSPYKAASIGYENLRKKTYAAAKNRSVKAVGQKMYSLASKRPGSLRHPMGPDAHATMLAARLLSPNLLHRIARLTLNFLQRQDMSGHS